ncbi:MAG TPA: response regulator, partial [Planctomycetes bacterium]|nr:response regulator [Planctomycetota bacterium]
GIAHDFNNLLMAIAGNTSLLLLESGLSKNLRASLDEIDSGVHKAAALTSQMLAYAGKGKFIETVIDFNSLIEEMGSLLSMSISKRVTVDYQLLEDPLPLKGNPTQLQQVVMNLLINASEASEAKGGSVTVITSHRHLEEVPFESVVLETEKFQPGDYLLFEVSDTGSGMSDSVLERCFEPFFSTKFTGRGLGLAAVLGIVRAHGGRIQVVTKEGEGTTFRVVLPLTEEKIVDTDDRRVLEFVGRGSGDILVIDDDPSVRRIVERMLSKVGYEVEIAESGEEGLEILRSNSKDFDLVLVDMEMPGINGECVGRSIREENYPVRIVLSSGYSEDVVSGTGEELFDAFIQKPYRIQELWEVLSRVLKSP